MPVNYYPAAIWDEKKLLAELKSLTEQTGRGRVSEVGAAGVKTVRDFGKVKDLDTAIQRVMYALYLLGQSETDADTKAANLLLYPNPYSARVMRVESRAGLASDTY